MNYTLPLMAVLIWSVNTVVSKLAAGAIAPPGERRPGDPGASGARARRPRRKTTGCAAAAGGRDEGLRLGREGGTGFASLGRRQSGRMVFARRCQGRLDYL